MEKRRNAFVFTVWLLVNPLPAVSVRNPLSSSPYAFSPISSGFSLIKKQIAGTVNARKAMATILYASCQPKFIIVRETTGDRHMEEIPMPEKEMLVAIPLFFTNQLEVRIMIGTAFIKQAPIPATAAIT